MKRKTWIVTFSTWGQSLAVRIPKGIAKALHLKPKEKARIIQEKDGFRIVPIGHHRENSPF